MDAALAATKGRLYSTETFGTVDGPGVRYVAFLQGCPLRCLYCHNPDSIPMEGGTETTAGALAAEVHRYRRFYGQGGGVTLSGGEPLAQPQFVAAVTTLLHEEGFHVTLDTAGMPLTAPVQEALRAVDLVMLDIKAGDDALCTKLTGRDTKAAFATLDWCEAAGKPVWIRHVLVQGYTLDDARLAQLADRLATYNCIQKVELLPFHKLGEPKWKRVARPYLLADTPATTRAEADHARAIFAARGLAVQ